jgi:hypothetical protein
MNEAIFLVDGFISQIYVLKQPSSDASLGFKLMCLIEPKRNI